MKVIVITGSRDWTDSHTISEAMQEHIDTAPDTLVIHGACRGADTIAADFAKRWPGCTEVKMPAKWSTFGNVAGPTRNAAMVDVAKRLQDYGHDVVVLGFVMPQSLGTRDMIRKCRQAGLRVVDFYNGPSGRVA